MSSEDSQQRTRASLLLQLREQPDDQAAWRDFVDRYGPTIYDWSRRHGLQTADAEDVTQSVLLKVALRMRTFVYDPAQRFRGWLQIVAQHAWADHVNDRKRAVSGSGDTTTQEMLNTTAARDDLVSRLEGMFDQELLALAQQRVRDRVAPHTWEAFHLTALAGESGAVAAAELGIQVATVFKAKSKVQKMLQEELAQLECDGPR